MRLRALAIASATLAFAACGRDAGISDPQARRIATAVNAVGTDPVTGATITTNKDDYHPGEMVHVVGSRWAPNETVHLVMTEDPDAHPDVTMDVVADSGGAFSVHFYDVQEHDRGVTFTLTAAGATSQSRATAVFTDSRILTLFEIQNPSTQAFVPAPGPVTVTLGSSVTIRATGTTDATGILPGADDWQSTSWLVQGPAPSTAVVAADCSSTIDITTATVDAQHVFSIPAPGVEGTYSLTIRAFQVDGCIANPSNVLSYANGLIVVAAPSNAAPAVDAGPNAATTEGGAWSQPGSFIDPDANTWSATVDYNEGAGVQPLPLSGKTFTLSHTYADNGNFVVAVEVNDGIATGSDLVMVHITNVPPTATLNSPASVNVGSPFTLSLTNPFDPSPADIAAGLQYAFDCGDGAGYSSPSTTSNRACPTSSLGMRNVGGKIADKDGGETEYLSSVAVTNAPPAVLAGGPYGGNEGAGISISGTAIDSDGSVTSTSWSVTPSGACTFGNASALITTVTCSDNGSFTLTLSATDEDGGVGSANASLTVNNLPPVISGLSALPVVPGNIYPVLQVVTIRGTYSDAGLSDTHTCSANATATGVPPVVGTDGTGSGADPNRVCSSDLTFGQAGVYDVTMTVTDDEGASDSELIQVVIFDPSAGSVTGGGWIDSPVGAFPASPTLTGRATFGFVAKSRDGIPEGNTRFTFHAGNFNFKSDGYAFLIVNQITMTAQFQGTGSVNGSGGYAFSVWVADGTPDTFRIKVWATSTGDVVYDNQLHASDLAVPEGVVHGSIVIHALK